MYALNHLVVSQLKKVQSCPDKNARQEKLIGQGNYNIIYYLQAPRTSNPLIEYQNIEKVVC